MGQPARRCIAEVRAGRHGRVRVNPFDDPSALLRVLVNEQGQYSLWPDDLEVPAGWSTVCAGLDQTQAVEYVEAVWTDLRPLDAREDAPARG